MADLILLNSSNWMEYFYSDLVYVMFSKSDCEECTLLESEIKSNEFSENISMCKVILDESGLSKMKIEFSWISSIDILPFNTILSGGKLVEYWSGKGIDRLNNRLKKHT